MTPDLACVRLCVRKGSKFGLWYGHHVYTLEPQSTAARYAAERVHVIGELSDDVIRITSSTAFRLQANQNHTSNVAGNRINPPTSRWVTFRPSPGFRQCAPRAWNPSPLYVTNSREQDFPSRSQAN